MNENGKDVKKCSYFAGQKYDEIKYSASPIAWEYQYVAPLFNKNADVSSYSRFGEISRTYHQQSVFEDSIQQ